MQTIKERDYLFDNYKAFLIIMVIIGHFIQPCYKNNSILYILKYFIYAFHMPAFIFVSGYFSKKDTPWKKAVQKVLIPYLVFQCIYYVYYTCAIGINVDWTLEYPKFSLWYLLALFVWKVITPYFRKIPHYFLISVILGLGIGCLPITGTYLSISRIVVFYPFFLAGMLLERGKLERLRTCKNRIFCALGVGTFFVAVKPLVQLFDFRLSYFYGKESYESLGQDHLEGIMVRMVCYAIGFFFTYAFAVLMIEKEVIFSKFGSATISIYLFHGLLFKFLEHKTTILEAVNTMPEAIGLLVFCGSLAFVFSLAPFCKFANLFANLSFRKLKTEACHAYSRYIHYWSVKMIEMQNKKVSEFYS